FRLTAGVQRIGPQMKTTLGSRRRQGRRPFNLHKITHHHHHHHHLWTWYLAQVALFTLESLFALGAAYSRTLSDSETLFPHLRAGAWLTDVCGISKRICVTPEAHEPVPPYESRSHQVKYVGAGLRT